MINPITLEIESEEERKLRERQTGVLGNGTSVKCYPTGDPAVWEQQHRSVCITKPMERCTSCRHSTFQLFFDPKLIELRIKSKYEMYKCPQWNSSEERIAGAPPEYYTDVERATCEIARPFPFCAQCPGIKDVTDLEIDRARDGWLTRWRRLKDV